MLPSYTKLIQNIATIFLALATILQVCAGGKAPVIHVPDMETCQSVYDSQSDQCQQNCVLANSFYYKGFSCYNLCYLNDQNQVSFLCNLNVKEREIIECGLYTDCICLTGSYSLLPTQCCTDSSTGIYCCQDSFCLLDDCTSQEQTIFAMVAFIGIGILYFIIYQSFNLFHRILKHKLREEQFIFITEPENQEYLQEPKLSKSFCLFHYFYHWIFDVCNVSLCYILSVILFLQKESYYAIFTLFFTILTRFCKNGLLLQYYYRVAQYCASRGKEESSLRRTAFLSQTGKASTLELLIARLIFFLQGLSIWLKIPVYLIIIFPLQSLLPFDALMFSAVERLHKRSKLSLKKLDRDVYFYLSYNAQIQLIFQDVPIQGINIFWIFRLKQQLQQPIALAALSIGCLSMIFRSYEFAYHLRKQYLHGQALQRSLTIVVREKIIALFVIACDVISKLFGWGFFAVLSLKYMAWVYTIYATLFYASLSNLRLIQDVLRQLQNDDTILKRICNVFLKALLFMVLSIEISMPFTTFFKLEKIPWTTAFDEVFEGQQYFDQLIIYHYSQWSMDVYRITEQIWFIVVIAYYFADAKQIGTQYLCIFFFCSFFSLLTHILSFTYQRNAPQQVEERSDRPNLGGLLRYMSRNALQKNNLKLQLSSLKKNNLKNNQNQKKEINLVSAKCIQEDEIDPQIANAEPIRESVIHLK